MPFGWPDLGGSGLASTAGPSAAPGPGRSRTQVLVVGAVGVVVVALVGFMFVGTKSAADRPYGQVAPQEKRCGDWHPVSVDVGSDGRTEQICLPSGPDGEPVEGEDRDRLVATAPDAFCGGEDALERYNDDFVPSSPWPTTRAVLLRHRDDLVAGWSTMVEHGPRRPRADLAYLQGVHVTGLESLAPDTTFEAYEEVVRSARRPGHDEQIDRMDEVIHVNCGF